MPAATVAVIGSGSLAHAVCRSLAVMQTAAIMQTAAERAARRDVEVLVMARNAAAARAACMAAGALAAFANRPLRFRHVPLDLGDAAGLTETLRAADPAGVVLCASYQSPWEGVHAPSAWTAMLSHAGFGLSLPLQAVPGIRTGNAIAQVCPRAWFVNACFPDAVNPVLAHLGVPATCGAGNVAMLGAALQHGLGAVDQSRLKVVAHHAHLHAPADPADEAWAWLDDEPLTGVTAALAELRATPRIQLVEIAGASAALLACVLLAGTAVETNVPGPLGLPGGYPVRIDGGVVSLRLPAGLAAADAIAFNQRAAARDGAAVDGGMVTFSPAARDELRKELPCLADGFAVTDITRACDRLLELRARLRAKAELEVDRDR